MISCPAAKPIRCVKPSIATVSPSRTRVATASCIVVCLELIRRPAVVRAAEDAELVALGIPHLRPERAALLDVPADGPAQRGDPFDLLGHRPRRPDVEMNTVLDGLRLGNGDEREHRIAAAIQKSATRRQSLASTTIESIPGRSRLPPSAPARRTQNSFPSGSPITVHEPWPSSTYRIGTAPKPRRRSTSSAIVVAGRRSRWTRFLTAFGSGTDWK